MSKQNGHFFVGLEKMLNPYKKQMMDAAQAIREQDISNYPILVASQQTIELGIPLLTEGKMPDNWLLNASTLEEFYTKQLITIEKVDEFRELYKKHNGELCIFVLIEDNAHFIFLKP